MHSRYRRQLADTAIGGYPVLIDIRVRRFFCDAIDCATKTFAELEGRIVTRTTERHAAVHQLLAQGRTISDISRILGLDRKTVRRFARATNAHDLISTARTRRGILDEYAPYLHKRIDAGCLDAALLTRGDHRTRISRQRQDRRTIRLSAARCGHPSTVTPRRAEYPTGHRMAHSSSRSPHRRGPRRAEGPAHAQPGAGHHLPARAGLRRDHGRPTRSQDTGVDHPRPPRRFTGLAVLRCWSASRSRCRHRRTDPGVQFGLG